MRAPRIHVLALLLFAGFTSLAWAQGGEEIVSRDSRGVPTFVRGELGTLGTLGGGERGAAAVQFLREITGRTFTGAARWSSGTPRSTAPRTAGPTPRTVASACRARC
ncbi:MAG: hypothetical protein ACJ76J_08505 [Thermoanaerobaculia bacterium]